MKNFILSFLQFIFSLIGSEWKKKFVTHLATIFKVNLLSLAYNKIGILNYRNLHESGEKHLIENIIPKYLSNKPILFDVGANVGNYTAILSKELPHSKIYSFEPNTETLPFLYNNTKSLSNVIVVNTGLSSKLEETVIYSQKSKKQSSLASLYHENIPEEDVLKIHIKLDTIDSFCQENKILKIDFLKIDTEGHEFKVLNGAKSMLKIGGINVIQFEFNEMNVTSKVFLKDFYDLLSQYNFYRLLPDGLLSLNPYNSRHEIFQFQNIICISKKLDSETIG